MTEVLKKSFERGIFVTAYAPFLEVGQQMTVPAVVQAPDQDGKYHSYDATAVVEFSSQASFRVRDGAKEYWVSHGRIRAAEWGLFEELDNCEN